MKNLMKKIFLTLILASLIKTAQASFEDFLAGGRATGLDGAMTAAPADVFSLYYNPASLVDIPNDQIGAYTGLLYQGLSDNSKVGRNFFGYSHPFDKQSVGISYLKLSLNNLYKEENYGLTYSRKLFDRFNAGVSLKYLVKSIGNDSNIGNPIDPLTGNSLSGNDPVFNSGHTAQNWSADLGATYKFNPKLTLGANIVNLNSPDLALGKDKDEARRTFRFGASSQLGKNLFLTDVSMDKFTSYDSRLHLGLERWLNKQFALRVGGGYGKRNYSRLNGGVSVRFNIFQLDYGVAIPFTTVKETAGIHQASLVVNFGGKKSGSENANIKPTRYVEELTVESSSAPTNEVIQENVKQAQADLESLQQLLSEDEVDLVYFDSDKSDVKWKFYYRLEKIANIMKKHPAAKLKIIGHADSQGNAIYNENLSVRRSLMVQQLLINKFGVPKESVSAFGMGESTPAKDNHTNFGRSKNRRVEFKIIEK